MPMYSTAGSFTRLASRFGGALALLLAPGIASAQQVPRTVPAEAPAAEAPAPVLSRAELRSWEEGDPVPRGYVPVSHVRTGMIVGGAVMFGSLYLISVLVAAANDDAARKSGTQSDAGTLYVPAVGPFLDIPHSGSSTANVFLVIDGAAQTAGIAMFVYGLTSPKTVLVRDAMGAKGSTISAVPMVGPGVSGLRLIGTF